MILVGNQRGNAKDMALHLMKAENEVVELHQLRGFLSSDLLGAFNEIYAISRGTKCSQFLYSLSLNPPHDAELSVAEFEAAIEEAEIRLGLQGQPRAIVFHVKNGRRHAHVVWSRIDITRMKAIQMSHDREKLMGLSRELFLQYGWEMPAGHIKRGDRDPLNYTHAQHQQAQRNGKSAADIKRDFQDAWAQSDNRISFEHTLAEKGYYLARGDTGRFVAVDLDGEVYSVPKMLAKGINTKDVRARLGDESTLPSLDQVRTKIAAMQMHEQDQLISEAKEFTIDDAMARIVRFHSAFTAKMMDRSLKRVVPDALTRHEMIAAIVKMSDIIQIGEQNGQAVYASKEMVKLEQVMMVDATDMISTSSHHVNHTNIDQAIAKLNIDLSEATNGTANISAQQIDALHHMCSDAQLSLIVGVAGAGKTTIMAGAKDAFEKQGYRVRGAAPSGIAASGLQEIGMNASTLHSLEYRIEIAKAMMDENDGKPLSV